MHRRLVALAVIAAVLSLLTTACASLPTPPGTVGAAAHGAPAASASPWPEPSIAGKVADRHGTVRLTPPAPPSIKPDPAAVHLAHGRERLASGDAREAAAHLRESLRLNPGNVGTLNALGVSLDLLGRHDEADRVYREGIERDPANVALRNNLGLSQAFAGDFDRAIQTLGATAVAALDGTRVRRNLALVYALAGDLELSMAVAMEDLPERDVLGHLAFYVTLQGLAGPTLARAVFDAGTSAQHQAHHAHRQAPYPAHPPAAAEPALAGLRITRIPTYKPLSEYSLLTADQPPDEHEVIRGVTSATMKPPAAGPNPVVRPTADAEGQRQRVAGFDPPLRFLTNMDHGHGLAWPTAGQAPTSVARMERRAMRDAPSEPDGAAALPPCGGGSDEESGSGQAALG